MTEQMLPGDVEHLAAIKARHAAVEGIDALSLTHVGGRIVFGLGDRVAAVQESASDDDIDKAIKIIFGPDDAPAGASPAPEPAAADPVVAQAVVAAAPAQAPAAVTAKPVVKHGSFALGLKAMMDEARTGLDQARADGQTKVRAAVNKLNDAKERVASVTDTMASTITSEADDVLAELGQISNEL